MGTEEEGILGLMGEHRDTAAGRKAPGGLWVQEE